MGRKTIVVVLGMHRSGTSAITRSLQVLGVELGGNLIPPNLNVNAKGFWEDADVNALNIELLDALGHDWHSLTPVLPGDFNLPIVDAFKLRAVQLLREKLSAIDCFGLKDPRIARLLPFWLSVFDHLDIHVSYVIACRHPMSVARSLAKRDGFALEKAYQLWLEHTLASLSGTQNQPRIVVSYDLLMEEPATQLQRIAQALGLPFDVESQAFAEYREEFLEEGLRHTRFEATDLRLDKAISPHVEELYSALLQMATDPVELDSPELDALLTRLQEGLRQNYTILHYTGQCEARVNECTNQIAAQEEEIASRGTQIDGLSVIVAERDNQIRDLSQTVTAQAGQIDGLNEAIAHRDVQVQGLNQTVAAQEVQIVNLSAGIADRDNQIQSLNLAVAAQEEQIVSLNADIADCGKQIQGLNQVVVAQEEQIASLNAGIVQRDNQIQGLSQTVSAQGGQIDRLNKEMAGHCEQAHSLKLVVEDRDRQVAAMQATLQALYMSTSWRMTSPLRYIGRIKRKAKDIQVIARRQLQNESWWALAKKVLRVWRREGVNGLKARVRYQHYLATLSVPTPLVVPTFSAPSVPAVPTAAPASPGVVSSFMPAALVRHPQGGYELAPASRGYTYIEPQRPAGLEAQLAALDSAPLFSIVVPVYNTTPELLEAVLSSVQAQWYPHWELILADDASPAEETRKALAHIDHPKIKVLRLDSNKGISGATNVGLEAAQGEFIVFMDHDDELTVDCLYELALCINRENPDFIYSDEDKLTEQGEYTQPHFKPDWSPDTMMSTMYTCHVSCVRRSLLGKVGGLRSEFDGCQDWDFVLRVAEHTEHISHIPKVLYHWRIIPASVASDLAAKPYVIDASRRARMEALARRGLKASLEPLSQAPGYYRVNYHLQGSPLVSIIVPTRDNGSVLRRCIDSIQEKSSYRYLEIIVLDNGSVEPSTVAYLKELQEEGLATVIRHDAPFNFSELNNIGVRNAKGELLLFLNDDTEVLCSDWLQRLGGYAQLPHIGAVGAKLLYPGGSEVQHAGVLNLENGPGHAFLRLPSYHPGYFMRNLLEYNWLAVTGACLMIEAEKFKALGGFDETLPVAYNDIELCMRSVEEGYYNVVCQAVTLIHHESVSRGLDHVDPVKLARLQSELRRLYDMHPTFFQYDPFYNPNLHPNGINFEVPA